MLEFIFLRVDFFLARGRGKYADFSIDDGLDVVLQLQACTGRPFLAVMSGKEYSIPHESIALAVRTLSSNSMGLSVSFRNS
ncbi:hypothetical protein RRF57_006116 [Xylaria bambusicola]|uniref:Uncharacterized protein n=1 Tax=Xylaria bambusicola TaxID=326684 RepID=A0AAN7URK1_9PEZI